MTTLVTVPPGVRAECEVRRAGEEQLLTSGHVVLCFGDRERGRPSRPPSSRRPSRAAA